MEASKGRIYCPPDTPQFIYKCTSSSEYANYSKLSKISLDPPIFPITYDDADDNYDEEFKQNFDLSLLSSNKTSNISLNFIKTWYQLPFIIS